VKNKVPSSTIPSLALVLRGEKSFPLLIFRHKGVGGEWWGEVGRGVMGDRGGRVVYLVFPTVVTSSYSQRNCT
jgi:hypothetical protein